MSHEPQDGIELRERDESMAAGNAQVGLESIDPINDYMERGLPSLNHKPFFLRAWVLLCAALMNIGWIIWLAIAYAEPLWQGPDFILDGLFSGYIATAAKFLITQQVLNVGKIMPYRNMRYPAGRNVHNTIDSDYWPYEWPVVRFRAIRNGDYFFQFVDIVAFIFTFAVVQFGSNVLSQQYDTNGNFLGYAPNRGVIIIVIICHSAFIVTTLAILVWLQLKETGLLADPGYLSLYLSIFNKGDIQEDFQGLEDEDRRWIVRQHLAQNEYRIGYWPKGPKSAVYGIRRRKISENIPSHSSFKPRSPTKYPEFRYIPWFLASFWVCTWTSLLTAALAIMTTLVTRDDIIHFGFPPYVSTTVTPFVDVSPAQFLWSFFPSFAADLFLLLVQSIDTFYRLVQPYVDLKRKEAKPKLIINCFRINYNNDLPLIVTIRALKNGHFKLAFISLFALFATLTPAWAANMFYVQNSWIAVWTRYFYPMLVYMCLLILFLLWTIPDQSRYMPRDLETIADHMALFSQSSLLDNGEFQQELPMSPIRTSPRVVSTYGSPASMGAKSNKKQGLERNVLGSQASLHWSPGACRERD
ncbi:uncharacterized protein BP5553_08234 [Venustampulla echinocandica]|uniref:Uncharacterized protein n=1 Tax=Venustampulla echinocandica TaxID=2656787 RepID=A0A370TG35_9HELO|nr:uncharacterized protein BP5553_08234 [Venustampulla echinocandica]RDL33866.1 hypothetical protein BP5553_08234 [Venustampulla echinocandica]